jgi:hypothetical protein
LYCDETIDCPERRFLSLLRAVDHFDVSDAGVVMLRTPDARTILARPE